MRSTARKSMIVPQCLSCSDSEPERPENQLYEVIHDDITWSCRRRDCFRDARVQRLSLADVPKELSKQEFPYFRQWWRCEHMKTHLGFPLLRRQNTHPVRAKTWYLCSKKGYSCSFACDAADFWFRMKLCISLLGVDLPWFDYTNFLFWFNCFAAFLVFLLRDHCGMSGKFVSTHRTGHLVWWHVSWNRFTRTALDSHSSVKDSCEYFYLFNYDCQSDSRYSGVLFHNHAKASETLSLWKGLFSAWRRAVAIPGHIALRVW